MKEFKSLKHDVKKYIEYFKKNDHLGKILGYKLIDLSQDQLLTEYSVKPEHFNPNGILHGGALYGVMDSSQGAFVHYILEEQYQFAATGTATIKYLAPVSQGRITITTTLERQEGRKLFVKSVANDPTQKPLAELNEIWIAIPIKK